MTEEKSMTEENMISYSEFVRYLVMLLIDTENPENVKIKEIDGKHTSIIEVSVAKADIGKVIGKKGKTINAIRTLLMSIASKRNHRVSLEVIEPEQVVPEHVV